MKKICLVSDGQPSTNPRLVKEADALYEAGYAVTVIFCQGWADWATKSDYELLLKRKWRFRSIPWSKELNPHLFYKSRIRFFLARSLYFHDLLPHFEEYVLNRVYPELLKVTLSEGADLYIAHYLGALAAAAKSARKYGAKLGFDAEDFHSAESNGVDEQTRNKMSRLVESIERKYLSNCGYMTASSEPIARAYASKYGVPKPEVVLNVSPLSIVSAKANPKSEDVLSLYWFSQTIGPGRGIEDAIHAMGKIRRNVRLHLQGGVTSHYKTYLMNLAAEKGLLGHQMVFMDCAFAEDIVGIASQFDIGLALEQKEPLNRNLCVTNKIFTYLMAGLSIIATETEGQMSVLKFLGKAGWAYPSGDVNALAERLEFLMTNKEELQGSKKEALRHATQKYNWGLEKRKFLDVIRNVLA